MNGAYPQLSCLYPQSIDAVANFLCCNVRVGKRDDELAMGTDLRQLRGDFMDQRSGLTAPGTSYKQNMSISPDCSLLFGVQAMRKCSHFPKACASLSSLSST